MRAPRCPPIRRSSCATTHAVEPVVRRTWLSPGVHVTSVGYNRKGREVDDATIADALVCVESRRATLAPFPSGSNDLLEPIRDGVITADHVHAELGQLLTGALPARTTPERSPSTSPSAWPRKTPPPLDSCWRPHATAASGRTSTCSASVPNPAESNAAAVELCDLRGCR